MLSSWTDAIKLVRCTTGLLKNKSPPWCFLHYTGKEHLELVTRTELIRLQLRSSPLVEQNRKHFWLISPLHLVIIYTSGRVLIIAQWMLGKKIINHKCIHYRQTPINCNMNINYASLSDKESLKAQLLATFCSISDVSSPTLSKWVITTDNHLQAAIKSFKLIPMTPLKTGTKLEHYLFFPTS